MPATHCALCRLRIASAHKRKDAAFCSEHCRTTFHNAVTARRRQCAACKRKLLIRATDDICATCAWSEYVRNEKRQLADVIDWLRLNSVCAYCGDIATDTEHVVPRRAGLPTYTVPSCRECNLFAGGNLFQSFREKAEHIRNRRSRKYYKLLRIPEWTDDELHDLKGNTRRRVVSLNEARELIQDQLEWRVESVNVDL